MANDELKLLEKALADALKLSAPLHAAERVAFVGQSLIAQHNAQQKPSAPPQTSLGTETLRAELPQLSKILTAAVNASVGAPGWPLLAVGNHLVAQAASSAAGSGEASASASASASAPASASAVPAPTNSEAGPSSASADAASEQPKAAGKKTVDVIDAPRGGYGSLGGGAKKAGYGNLGKGKAEAGAGLTRQLTFTEMEKRAAKSRPATLPPSALEKLDMNEVEEGAQSARAATSSWSLTGGTREASFKKRAGDRPPSQSSEGFATVLSLSGWSDADAQEVTLRGADMTKGSLSEREKAAKGGATTSVLGGVATSVVVGAASAEGESTSFKK